jgi:hypothetical protein
VRSLSSAVLHLHQSSHNANYLHEASSIRRGDFEFRRKLLASVAPENKTPDELTRNVDSKSADG